MQSNYRMLIGAVIAAALAFAVYYGLIGQQTATSIQNQANQTLGTGPATQQPAPQPPTTPVPQAPTAPAPASPAPPSSTTAPQP